MSLSDWSCARSVNNSSSTKKVFNERSLLLFSTGYRSSPTGSYAHLKHFFKMKRLFAFFSLLAFVLFAVSSAANDASEQSGGNEPFDELTMANLNYYDAVASIWSDRLNINNTPKGLPSDLLEEYNKARKDRLQLLKLNIFPGLSFNEEHYDKLLQSVYTVNTPERVLSLYNKSTSTNYHLWKPLSFMIDDRNVVLVVFTISYSYSEKSATLMFSDFWISDKQGKKWFVIPFGIIDSESKATQDKVILLIQKITDGKSIKCE